MPATQPQPTILTLLLAALSACACRPEIDQPTREPAAAQLVALECPDPPTAQPVAPEPPDPPPAREPSTRFTIHPPKTEVWSVLDGRCRELYFKPYHEQAGYMFVGGGGTVQYELIGDRIELFSFSKRSGKGLMVWSCFTVMQLGENGRLGEADLFASTPDCEAGQATAAPLDDSPELIKRKCSGEQLAVDTEEVKCAGKGKITRFTTPGCISLIAKDIALIERSN
jgi:hypothetical protein